MPETFLTPDTIDSLAEQCSNAAPPEDAEACGTMLVAIAKLQRALKGYVEDVEASMHEAMPDKTIVVDGALGGGFTKTRAAEITKWDREAALMWVMDSRRFDADGKLIEETLADKIMHVYNLGDPRVTNLKERGATKADIDELRTKTYGRPKIIVNASEGKALG